MFKMQGLDRVSHSPYLRENSGSCQLLKLSEILLFLESRWSERENAGSGNHDS